MPATQQLPHMDAHPSVRVLVTGLTGYIAAAVTKALLQKGYVVHATIRPQSTNRLPNLSSRLSQRLHVFHADLEDHAAFDVAAHGCTYAVHLASPNDTSVPDPVSQLVNPAVNGTRNVLNACQRAGVHKVLVMSSHAALADRGQRRRVDEADWNTSSTIDCLPSYYAKTAAERAAWEFANEAVHSGPQVVVLNPAVVWGRSPAQGLNSSKELLVRLARGDMAGVIDLALPIVHVVDVARAVVALLEYPAAEGRYVCCPDEPLIHVRDIVEAMHNAGLKPPRRDLSARTMTMMIKFSSHVVPGGIEGQFIRNHLGNPVTPSNNKIVTELGMKFTDVSSTLRETIEELVEKGYIDPAEDPLPFDTSQFHASAKKASRR